MGVISVICFSLAASGMVSTGLLEVILEKRYWTGSWIIVCGLSVYVGWGFV